MREHPNAAIVRRAYEAFARDDHGTVRDVVSRDALSGFIAALDGDSTHGAFEIRMIVPLAIAAAGDLVVSIDHFCARRGGRPLDVEGVVIFAMRDRKIAQVTRFA